MASFMCFFTNGFTQRSVRINARLSPHWRKRPLVHDLDQMSDVRCQRSEIRDQMSEVRSQRSDVGEQRSEGLLLLIY